MKDNQQFGARLKDLRTIAGMSLRELALKINVNFTYLSKIENGILPPPSEKVIRQLAETLNADKDELLTLAGKIPADIVEILKERGTLERLRAERTNKETTPPTRKEMTPGETRPGKHLGRIALAATLSILAAIFLWFASPVTDTAVASNNKGVAYNNNKDYINGVVAFNKAIEIDPYFAIAYNNRGWAYVELSQYEQGIADCSKAIELNPGLAIAYSNRGLAYLGLGQYEQVIADCSKAIKLDPGLALAYSNRGTAYLALGQYEQAIADLDKAIELNPGLQYR